jgi:hypothetical protein
MMQLLLAMASTLPGFIRVPLAGLADRGADPTESSAVAAEAESENEAGADEEYCDITLPLILERRGRENGGR